jgi:hypothetical protein
MVPRMQVETTYRFLLPHLLRSTISVNYVYILFYIQPYCSVSVNVPSIPRRKRNKITAPIELRWELGGITTPGAESTARPLSPTAKRIVWTPDLLWSALRSDDKRRVAALRPSQHLLAWRIRSTPRRRPRRPPTDADARASRYWQPRSTFQRHHHRCSTTC